MHISRAYRILSTTTMHKYEVIKFTMCRSVWYATCFLHSCQKSGLLNANYVWLQIRYYYAPELQQVGCMLRLKMLTCIFHHLVLLLLATRPSIIIAETASNDSPGPSHYWSLNSVSSIFCITPDSQLSTLSGCKTKSKPVVPLTSSASLSETDFSLLWSHCSEKTTHASWC